MPGLSASRADRIIELCSVDLDSVSDFRWPTNQCWRCCREVLKIDQATCSECLAWMACESDYDPAPDKDDAPMPNPFMPSTAYFWLYAHSHYGSGIDIAVAPV